MKKPTLILTAVLLLAAASLSAQRSCGTVTDYDGNTYNTVQISKQCWLKENLHSTHYPDGKEIVQGSVYDKKSETYKYRASFDKGYWYYPNGRPRGGSYFDSYDYGLLYNWKAAMYKSSTSSSNPSRVQGVCPDGWHLPSWSEWEQLVKYVYSQPRYYYDSKPVVRKALASKYEWKNTKSDELQVGNPTYDNNVTGFNAFPTGHYNQVSFPYMFFGNEASFWSCTKDYEKLVLTLTITTYYAFPTESISSDTGFENEGLSVRCVRN